MDKTWIAPRTSRYLGLEEPDAITPVGLGFVHCQIGAFQKPLRVVSVFRRQCNANAYCGDDRLPLNFIGAVTAEVSRLAKSSV